MQLYYFSLDNKQLFRFFVFISFLAHLAGGALLVMFPLLKSSEPLHIKQAIRVDVVGLPEKHSPDKRNFRKPKKTAPKPLPKKKSKALAQKKIKKKEAPKKKPEESLKQTQTAQAEAIKKLKSQEAKVYKGEQISKGSSQQGEVSELLIYAYFSRLRAHVMAYWDLPRLLADKNLKAIVSIQVNPKGDITRIELEKTSGNEAFDQIVIETIKNSSPLPQPPEELSSLLKEGVGFRFPD